jgi:hypothetical protein
MQYLISREHASQDLAILRATRAPALLVGPTGAVDAAIATLQSELPQPVVAWTPTETRDVPVLTAGTLIVRNIGHLERDQQERLLDIVDSRRHDGVQVISTSGRSHVALG